MYINVLSTADTLLQLLLSLGFFLILIISMMKSTSPAKEIAKDKNESKNTGIKYPMLSINRLLKRPVAKVSFKKSAVNPTYQIHLNCRNKVGAYVHYYGRNY